MKVVINKVNLLLVVNHASLNVIKTQINNIYIRLPSVDIPIEVTKGVHQKRE